MLEIIELKSQDEQVDEGYLLAAAFDLLVGAEYYSYKAGSVFAKEWLVCCDDEADAALLLTPFVNACPRCSSCNKFFWLGHLNNFKSLKPKSGTIGTITAESLSFILATWLHRKGKNVQVYFGKEPFDVIIRDESESVVMMAEVKSGPLVTIPLAVSTDDWPANSLTHCHGKGRITSDDEVFLFIPKWSAQMDKWDYRLVSLGVRGPSPSKDWVHRAITRALDDESVFDDYIAFWLRALHVYSAKDKSDPIYWLTGASGAPKVESWTKQMRTISDSKTSVGLDRTDDIKKGIYQVIKARHELSSFDGDYTVKTGVISNTHAIRHGDDYIVPVRDANIYFYNADNTNEDDEYVFAYKLYDEIVTFTEKLKADEWIMGTFDW